MNKNKSVSEGMYENLAKSPQMAPKVDAPKQAVTYYRYLSDEAIYIYIFNYFPQKTKI